MNHDSGCIFYAAFDGGGHGAVGACFSFLEFACFYELMGYDYMAFDGNGPRAVGNPPTPCGSGRVEA